MHEPQLRPWSASHSDESRDTAFEVLRYAHAMEPRWIVIENVIRMCRWSRYQELLNALRGAEYRVTEHRVDAADHGVRQRRKRLFLICDREAEPPFHIQKRPGPKPSAVGVLDRLGTWNRSLLATDRRAPATLERAGRAVAALGSNQSFLIVYYGNDGAGGWQPLTVPLRTVTTVDRFGLCEPTEDGPTLRMLQVPELAARHGIRGRPDPRSWIASRSDHASGQRRVPAGDGGRRHGAHWQGAPERRHRFRPRRLTGTRTEGCWFEFATRRGICSGRAGPRHRRESHAVEAVEEGGLSRYGRAGTGS